MSEQRKTHAQTAGRMGGRSGRPHAARRGPGAALAAIAIALRRRVRLFGAILGAALIIGVLAIALQVPRYVATAEVLLQTHGGTAAPRAFADALARDRTELRVIGSYEMARTVATALDLDRDAGFVAAEHCGPIDRLRRGCGARGDVRKTPETTRQVLDRLQRNLAVEPIAGTYSLAISFASVDPRRAADVVNAYARAYTAGPPADAAAGARPRARLISEAEPPISPASPRPLLILSLALLAGAVLGAIAAGIAEWRFSAFTSSSDVQAKLGLVHLGSVPTLASVLPDARDPLAAIVEAPLSGFAEAFRSLFLTIRQVGGRKTQVIAITSSLPNEGKTTIAACLARSIALANESIVLIDCDARRRDVSALFGADGARPGLAQVLRYEATLDEALIRDAASGAWVLPLTGPPADLSEAFGGAAMGALLEDLRRRFKRIVIDSAPVLAISDTRALVTQADLVVVVVRWRLTSSRAVQAALRLLPDRHVRIGGVVLSQIDMLKTGNYGQEDPAFYYKAYKNYYS